MKHTNAPRRRMAFLLLAFIISAIILGALIYRKYEQRRLAPPPPPPVQESGTILVSLFFADPAGNGLKREVREIDACGDLPLCLESVMDELMNGPLGDLEPTLPGSFSLREVRVQGDMAIIDLENEAVEGLPESSSAEMSAVYSIVDSIIFNFPQIRRVQFLLEGKAMPTLKGHLDLQRPLVADFTLVRK